MELLPPALVELIAAENAMAARPSISAVADAARRRHGPGIAAVLFYGSCLRGGDDVEGVVDLYLLADSYDQIHRGPLMRIFNRLLPPNVKRRVALRPPSSYTEMNSFFSSRVSNTTHLPSAETRGA